MREAERICRESFEDDPEALEEELVVIKTQLAFVLQMRGRHNEANNIYNSVLKQKDADQAVLAVASNNIGESWKSWIIHISLPLAMPYLWSIPYSGRRPRCQIGHFQNSVLSLYYFHPSYFHQFSNAKPRSEHFRLEEENQDGHRFGFESQTGSETTKGDCHQQRPHPHVFR